VIAIPVGILIMIGILVGWFLTAGTGWEKFKYGCGCLVLVLIVVVVVAFNLLLSR
jgi:hypothetical protein